MEKLLGEFCTCVDFELNMSRSHYLWCCYFVCKVGLVCDTENRGL